MDQSRRITIIFKRNFLIMKVIVELYGATKDLSNKNFLEFEIEKNSSIKDLKIKILSFIENQFKGNQDLRKIVENSAFCSDDDNIVSENYIISKNQTIGIIPPIGGGWCFTLK